MSEEEKARQVGNAIASYQERKADLAHIEMRLRSVGLAYHVAFNSLNFTQDPIRQI